MDSTDTRLDTDQRRRIAEAFRPGRWNVYYVRSKLATDPLYAGVTRALIDCDAPVLDLGCGLGLLAHCLAAAGQASPYLGVDNDSDKIRQASEAARRAGLDRARFSALDLSVPGVVEQTGHRGSVVMLDLLQFVPPASQEPIIRQAAACLTPASRLIIRTGLAGRSWRARVTRSVDSLSRLVRWMNIGPQAYPARESLEVILSDLGLDATFTPLWGRTPFNNWLIQAEPAHPASERVSRSHRHLTAKSPEAV